MKKRRTALLLALLTTASAASGKGMAQTSSDRAVSLARDDLLDAPHAHPRDITGPEPLETPAAYPQAGVGPADVVLELVITARGDVGGVVVVSGQEPFGQAALQAAAGWRFRPARADGQAVAAKIRFLVEFRPPESEPPPSPPLPSAAAPSSTSPTEVPAAPTVVHVEAQRSEGSVSLGSAQVKALPGAFGDPFRAIEVLPGVTPVASGLPYFYVRGAPPGNTAFLLDGVPVPLLFHFAAGPAIVHPAFISTTRLYSGAYPARLGPATGGVVEGASSVPGDSSRIVASARLVDAGLYVATPFAEGQGHLQLGGRYSYTGLIVSLVAPNIELSYWDYQAKIGWELGGNDRLELLSFGAADFYAKKVTLSVLPGEAVPPEADFETALDLTFHRADLRWIREWQDGELLVAATAGLDRSRLSDDQIRLANQLGGLRFEFQQQLGEQLRLRAGASSRVYGIRQRIDADAFGTDSVAPSLGTSDVSSPAPSPGEAVEPTLGPGDDAYDLGFGDRSDSLTSLYADLQTTFGRRLDVTAGVRGDLYTSGRQQAFSVEPRLRSDLRVTSSLALIHGLGLAHQAPTFPIPAPGLVPNLKGGLQRAVQHEFGPDWGFAPSLRLSARGYHNIYYDFTDVIGVPGGDVGGFRTSGSAYGLEVGLKRQSRAGLSGLVTYTLGRSLRSRQRYGGPAATDRTHVVNAAFNWPFATHWQFGARGLLYTGVPAAVDDPTLRGSRRTTPFWRLDWRLERSWHKPGGPTWRLVAEVLNTTLNEEMVGLDCSSAPCRGEYVGPVTIPSVGLEFDSQ